MSFFLKKSASPPGLLLKQRMDALRPRAPYDMEKFMIYRLPKVQNHEGNKFLFEPLAVSIGLYYRGRENLNVMEEYKLLYLRDFLARNPKVDLEGCIQEIQPLEEEARNCYNKVVHLSSTEFVEMLLLDGCFILELSLKYLEKAHDIMCRPGFLFEPIRMDLLLFENQIPFFVLDKLYYYVCNHFLHNEEFVDNIFMNLFFTMDNLGPPKKLRGKIYHLLHLYHELFVPRLKSQAQCSSTNRSNCSSCIEILKKGNCHVMPCATQLREAGVSFRYKKLYKYKFDIKFENGVIEIPTLKIDANLKRLYPNLLAFEVCLCYPNRTLSSYIVLLDLLINTKGVELLQRSGIIENTLANDEELADYLNLVGKISCIDYKEHYFRGLFEDILAHYNLGWNKHRARFVHDYCSSPWTFISVFAAFVELILTFVQAFFAFYPYMK